MEKQRRSEGELSYKNNWQKLIDLSPQSERDSLSEEMQDRVKNEAINLSKVIDGTGLNHMAETLLMRPNNLIAPKRIRIEQVSEAGLALGFESDEEVRLEGEAEQALKDHWWGGRAVHFPEKVTYQGEEYYLDVKGLGKNGKRLYTWHHDEGDPFFGTYFDGAAREFEIPKEVMELGLADVQIPVFLAELPEAEYVRHAAVGLYETLSARLGHIYNHEQTVAAALKHYPAGTNPEHGYEWTTDAAYRLAADLAVEMYDGYLQDGVEGIRHWADKYHAHEEVAVLTSSKKFGVSARLIKNPGRVGALDKAEWLAPENRAMARKMGGICRTLVENGYWPISPSPANWTMAGEFVDFEDVIKWPQDTRLAADDMWSRHIPTVWEYIRYTFGKGCMGELAEDFQTGFMGRKTMEDELVDEASKALGFLV